MLVTPLFILPCLFILGALAWFLSTFVAGGAASLLLPILTILIGAHMAAPTIAIAAIAANPTRAFVFANYINWKVITFLLPGTCIGAFIGAYSFTQLDAKNIQLVIGLFLVSTIFQDKLQNMGIKLITKAHWFFPLGILVSFISGLVGAVGPIYNPFLVSYGLTKEDLIGTKAFNSFIMQITKVLSYSAFGAVSSEILVLGIVLGLGGVSGVILAKKRLLEMDQALFKKIMYTFMPLIGLGFIYQGLFN